MIALADTADEIFSVKGCFRAARRPVQPSSLSEITSEICVMNLAGSLC